MGGFSNFAISFSIISILTGAVTLYDYGLTMGGPLEMTLGWPIVTAGTLLVALLSPRLRVLFCPYIARGATYATHRMEWGSLNPGR